MTIGQAMTTSPVTADATSTVASALKTLHDLDVRHLPIVDRGELVGILSDRDLRGFVGIDEFDLDAADALQAKLQTPVSEIMATDLVTMDPETALVEAIDRMILERVGAIPIVQKNTSELVGILSYIDILKAVRAFAPE